MSGALRDQSKLDEAVASLRHAIALQPHQADAYNNLGVALSLRGNVEEAIASYGAALRLDPHHPDAHWNRALTWLLMGNYDQGWPEYEWRWKRRGFAPRPLPQPLWDGSPLEGRTILLHAEQGLGDSLQFIRYAHMVKARGGTVLFESRRGLVPLLRNLPGIDRVIACGDELPPFDVHAPLLSLPWLFHTTLSTIPSHVPYLSADTELVEHWRRELAGTSEFKVGIVWQGDPKFKEDRHRSIPLVHYEPLARVSGVRLVSLQKGFGIEQLTQIADRFAVTDLGSKLDEETGAFMDTAAVMKNLDLVITSDTAIVHLAGGLGVPAWVALSAAPDWRFLLHLDDSPWYPTMRLFRQERLGDWPSVFDRMASELARLAGSAQSINPLRVEIAPGELFDKITILQIKRERIADPTKLSNVRAELSLLERERDRTLNGRTSFQGLIALATELKAVNQSLWRIEDDIRECERASDFGPRFVELARSVYQTNDCRAAIKRRINELFGSRITEEKAYAAY